MENARHALGMGILFCASGVNTSWVTIFTFFANAKANTLVSAFLSSIKTSFAR